MSRFSRRTILGATPLIGGAILLGSCGQAVTAPSAGEAEAQPEAKQPEAQPEPEVKDVIVWLTIGTLGRHPFLRRSKGNSMPPAATPWFPIHSQMAVSMTWLP